MAMAMRALIFCLGFVKVAADDAWMSRVYFGGEGDPDCGTGVELTEAQCVTFGEVFFFNDANQVDLTKRSLPVGCWIFGNTNGKEKMGQVYYSTGSFGQAQNNYYPVCLFPVEPDMTGREDTIFIAPGQECPAGFEPVPYPHLCREAALEKFHETTWEGSTNDGSDPCGCIVRNGAAYWNWQDYEYSETCSSGADSDANPVCWQTVPTSSIGQPDSGTYYKVHFDLWCGPYNVFDCFADREYNCIMPNGGGSGDCPGGFETCITDNESTAAEKCGCDHYNNGVTAADDKICRQDIGYKVGKWQTTCAEYTTRAACEAECDADPDCNYMVYGWNPVGKYFRCAGFKSCNTFYDYWDGDVVIYVKPSNFVNNETEDWYRKEESGVGSWGGVCTCPNGMTYQVGDYSNGCASIACENGVWDSCSEGGITDAAYNHYKVTCAPVDQCMDDYGAFNKKYCTEECNAVNSTTGCGTLVDPAAAPGGGDYKCHCGGCNGCMPAPWTHVD